MTSSSQIDLKKRAAARPVSPQTVEKPWGREIIFAASTRFAGKLLEINAGERLSVHFHRDKHEVLCVIRGTVRIFVREEPDRVERYDLVAGQAFEFPPGTVHRIEAVEDALLVESSSPEIDDVTRISDDYGRAPH